LLFTAATAVFRCSARALRAARSPRPEGLAGGRRASRAADKAAERLTTFLDDQHRFVDAYLNQIRPTLLDRYPSQIDQMEDTLRKHLYGSEPS
jgi:hypothetical protein